MSHAFNSSSSGDPAGLGNGAKRSLEEVMAHPEDEQDGRIAKKSKQREQGGTGAVHHSLSPLLLERFREAARNQSLSMRVDHGLSSVEAYLASLSALKRSERVKVFKSDLVQAKRSHRDVRPHILGSAFLIRNELYHLLQLGYPLEQAVQVLTERMRQNPLDAPFFGQNLAFESISLDPAPSSPNYTPFSPLVASPSQDSPTKENSPPPPPPKPATSSHHSHYRSRHRHSSAAPRAQESHGLNQDEMRDPRFLGGSGERLSSLVSLLRPPQNNPAPDNSDSFIASLARALGVGRFGAVNEILTFPTRPKRPHEPNSEDEEEFAQEGAQPSVTKRLSALLFGNQEEDDSDSDQS